MKPGALIVKDTAGGGEHTLTGYIGTTDYGNWVLYARQQGSVLDLSFPREQVLQIMWGEKYEHDGEAPPRPLENIAARDDDEALLAREAGNGNGNGDEHEGASTPPTLKVKLKHHSPAHTLVEIFAGDDSEHLAYCGSVIMRPGEAEALEECLRLGDREAARARLADEAFAALGMLYPERKTETGTALPSELRALTEEALHRMASVAGRLRLMARDEGVSYPDELKHDGDLLAELCPRLRQLLDRAGDGSSEADRRLTGAEARESTAAGDEDETLIAQALGNGNGEAQTHERDTARHALKEARRLCRTWDQANNVAGSRDTVAAEIDQHLTEALHALGLD